MIRFPVLQPFKFYRAGLRTDGINFSNPDNIEWNLRDQSGVYSVPFFQPVQLIWNDFTTGLDFQVYVDVTPYDYELESESGALIDLETEELLAHGANMYIRVFYDIGSSPMIPDGIYRIKISSGEEVWYSEWLDVKGWGIDKGVFGYLQQNLTFNHCVPFEFGHFENNYGAFFADGYKFKMMVPLRLYKPLTKAEKNVYRDDPGVMTTLQSVPTRAYEFETLPVPAWFAEKMQMAFNCSNLTLNKIAVNAEAIPESEIVSSSDLFSVRGEVVLSGFNSDYFAENSDIELSGVEQITEWVNTNFTSFTAAGKNITSAINTDQAVANAVSNDLLSLNDTPGRLVFVLKCQLDKVTSKVPYFYIDTEDSFSPLSAPLNSGMNTLLFSFNFSAETGYINAGIIGYIGSNFSLIPSIKKIILS